jgi:hypothetical protein
MGTLTVPLCSALEQILPDLHSVEIKTFDDPDNPAALGRFCALSDRATKMEGSKS